MKSLPENAAKYAATPEFTETTIPEKLKKSHLTKPGAWAKIVILEGKLRYLILEPEPEETVLSPGSHGVVEPDVLHQVEPIGKVRFYLEFYR